MKTIVSFFLITMSAQEFFHSAAPIVSGTFPLEYKNIHRQTLLKDQLMIAGKFNSGKKEEVSYRDSLREKLQTRPGFYGF
jgi:hypothetical protein